jgi:hypothetical protein
VDNAFCGLDFGCKQEIIFRAAFADILHTIEEGALHKLLEVFYGLMGNKQRTEIDNFVHSLFCEGHNRSSEKIYTPEFPSQGATPN